ncbi:MAG: Asp-tRNA(Asn)/Glu-tRNA(Gln) amidotransferase GatCAB subunit B, partial [Chloroflexi bacterium]|nr:Asp-tRNA(Asn)/Glu-tRNA(Gln) amidotransferase GatCAB subunit B [Chloroflexota bacterium]
EEAHDYRFFPEPDLPPLEVSPAWVDELRARLPELPDARRDRFVSVYGLPQYDADLLTTTRAMADFYEQALHLATDRNGDAAQVQAKAKSISNWVLTEVNRLLNQRGVELAQTRITPAGVVELLGLVEAGTINLTAAKAVFEEMFDTGKAARQVVDERGLTQISGADELTALVDRIVTGNPQAVADFQAGKQNAIGFLVGQVMRESRGRANAALVTGLLRERLNGEAAGV